MAKHYDLGTSVGKRIGNEKYKTWNGEFKKTSSSIDKSAKKLGKERYKVTFGSKSPRSKLMKL